MQEDTLGHRIKVVRKQYRWSQAQFAERIGVSTMTVIRWEHNQSLPREDVHQVLQQVLGVTSEEFTRLLRENHTPDTSTYDWREKLLMMAQTTEMDMIEVVAPAVQVYEGWRDEHGHTRVRVDGRPLPFFPDWGDKRDPEKSYLYEWGYGGQGPRMLATSILADYFQERRSAKEWVRQADYHCLQHSQDFKWEVVCNFPEQRWKVTGEQITAWLSKKQSSGR